MDPTAAFCIFRQNFHTNAPAKGSRVKLNPCQVCSPHSCPGTKFLSASSRFQDRLRRVTQSGCDICVISGGHRVWMNLYSSISHAVGFSPPLPKYVGGGPGYMVVLGCVPSRSTGTILRWLGVFSATVIVCSTGGCLDNAAAEEGCQRWCGAQNASI